MTRYLIALASLSFAFGCATVPPAGEPAYLAPAADTTSPFVQDWDPYRGEEQGYDPYDAYDRPGPSEVKRFAWDLWGLFGFRNLIGGKAKGEVESPSPLFGLGTGPVFRVGPSMGIAPGMFALYSPMESDRFDVGWDVLHLGVNFRWLFVYNPRLSAYAMGEYSITEWEGRGTDGFIAANDVDGNTLSIGAGVDFYLAPKFSIGGQMVHRSFSGDHSTSATWLDIALVLQGHF